MTMFCAVVGCTSSYSSLNPFADVTFHRITKNKKILPLWQRVVDLRTYNNAKICSLHFRPEDVVVNKHGKRLKWDAVPIVNVCRNETDETDDNSLEEDEEDNKNLSMLKELLTSDSNHGTAATQDNDDDFDDEQPQKFEVVISSCNSTTCNSVKAKTATSKEMKSASTQVNRTTDGEIALRQRVKVLGMRLKRRDAKISYMKTVFNMIKKNVKGTDMEYKLSCELQNISKFSEPIKSNVKNNSRNARSAKTESPVTDCVNDDESSADENGMVFEVTLSPNLTLRDVV